ncbi:MAG: ATP-binding protein [Clostridiales bacterium]|jgi:hypothetical protein|nr:ATP-binding protein [Clostridiales bacterium]
MMKDLSMHILDIAQNSVRAEATDITIEIDENVARNTLSITVADNGRGMSAELLKTVRDPFTTSRTTRKVGLGIPMLEQTCLQCDGRLALESTPGKGTTITAAMAYNHIDRPPLGDLADSLLILLITNQAIHFIYNHRYNGETFVFDTAEIREILGDTPFDLPEVRDWIKEYMTEGIAEIKENEESSRKA